MNIDPSAVSKSSEVSYVSGNTRKSSYIKDRIFPLFDHMSQKVEISPLIYYFQILFIGLQAIMTSLWANSKETYKYMEDSGKFLNYLDCIAKLKPYSETSMSLATQFGVYTACFIISVFFFVYENLYYAKRHRFNIYTTYVCRLFIEVAPSMMITPVGMLLGRLYERINHVKQSQLIFMFSLTIIVFIGYFVMLVLVFRLFSISPYLNSYPIACYDILPLILFNVSTSIFLIFSTIAVLFPFYIHFILVIIHLLEFVYIYSLLICKPFISKATNLILMTFILDCIFLDLMKYVDLLVQINTDIVCIVIFVLLILSYGISYLILYMREKSLKIAFSYNDLKDSDTSALYNQLKLNKSQFRAKEVLHYLIEKRSEYFTSMSIVKYLYVHHSDSTIAPELIKVLCFFPCESRLLYTYHNEMMRKKKMSIFVSFLCTQVSWMKFIRQSSTSRISTEKLNQLNQLTKDIQDEMNYFWSASDVSFNYFIHIHRKSLSIRSLWEESLIEFPNSTIHAESFNRFLFNCQTDFKEGIVIKNRINMIENGKNFNSDTCFKHFIHVFPDYLKKGVIDTKGNFVNKRKVGKNSVASLSKQESDGQMSNSSISTIDAVLEEEIGKNLVNHCKLRLTLQATTKDKKPNNYNILLYAFIFIIVSVIVFIIFIFTYFFNYFDSRTEISDMLGATNDALYYLLIGNMGLLLAFSEENGIFDIGLASEFQKKDGDDLDGFIDFDIKLRDNVMIDNVYAKRHYDKFLSMVVNKLENDLDVFDLFTNIMEDTSVVYYCANGTQIPKTFVNFKVCVVYNMMNQAILSGRRDSANWFNGSTFFCSLETSFQVILSPFQTIRTKLAGENTNDYIYYKGILKEFIIITFPVFIVLTFLPLIIGILIVMREITKFKGILLSFNSEIKKSAMQSLIRSDLMADQSTNERVQSCQLPKIEKIHIASGIILFLIFFLAVIIELQFNLDIAATNTMMEYISVWATTSRRRKIVIMRMVYYICQALILSNSSKFSSTFTDSNKSITLAEVNIPRLEYQNKVMIIGANGIPPCTNFDHVVDEITFKEVCQASKSSTDPHELYKCASAYQLTGMFNDYLYNLRSKLDSFKGRLDSSEVMNFIHLANSHLVPAMLKIDEQTSLMIKNHLKGYKTNETLIFISELFITLIIIVCFINLLSNLNAIYSSMLVLMRRISPIDLVSNKELMKYLMNRNTESSGTSNSTECSIIHKSSNCIILANLNGLIEVINPSVTTLLGYTPEQLLGRTVISVIDENEQTKIGNQINLILNNESSPIFEGHTVCVTDNDCTLPCEITILGMKCNNEVKSFVIILRDESELVKQQEIAENAKKRSESLLYQILPRSIVIRLNHGEKDISYVVPSATICFIDIVRFSEYAALLTPQEIMCNLSMLFGDFDELMKKYPLLYKIKLIGDVYMCAGGLFDLDSSKNMHAEQMIKFGIDCFIALEEFNLKFSSLLNVRIGINTGGPLIAGVLGTDKPVFDIIGDPINIAARLQSTDLPGNIQISEDTYESIIDPAEYSIEPRGEVFLKGKGNRPAYIVRPIRTAPFQCSSSEI